jgi:hypothetical protein
VNAVRGANPTTVLLVTVESLLLADNALIGTFPSAVSRLTKLSKPDGISIRHLLAEFSHTIFL